MDRLQANATLLPPGAPRYLAVAAALERDIGAGRYEVGGKLPPELELCALYGVSRHTVREATRRLVDMGLISRHPGIGTQVRARSAVSRFSASLGSIEELMQYTRQTRLDLIHTSELGAHGELAEQLGCREGQRWLLLHTLRYPVDEARPISITDIYVPPEFRDIERFFGSGSIAVYRLIEKHFGERIVEVRQDIGALALSAAHGRLLGVPQRSPGLDVVRTYVGTRERVLSISKNVYPADRFRLSTRWRLGWETR